MSLINCPECGHKVSDAADVCPECGYPIAKMKAELPEETCDKEEVVTKEKEPKEEKATDNFSEKTEKEDIKSTPVKKVSPKILIGIVLVIGIIFVAWFIATSDSRNYNAANKLMKQGKYQDAITKLTKLDDYKDSKELIKKCEHLEIVQKDKKAPVITGIKDKSDIKVTCGTTFNLTKYIKKRIKVKDDITEGDIDYSIECTYEVYNSATGDVQTTKKGKYPVKIVAKDEAKNESQLDLVLKLEPVHVTKKNPHPIVYKGDIGTIKVNSFGLAVFGGDESYHILFGIDNKSDNTLFACIDSSYINDYLVDDYYTMQADIEAGKKGETECDIYTSDIPKEAGKVKQIESTVLIKRNPDSEVIISIPILFDVF